MEVATYLKVFLRRNEERLWDIHPRADHRAPRVSKTFSPLRAREGGRITPGAFEHVVDHSGRQIFEARARRLR